MKKPTKTAKESKITKTRKSNRQMRREFLRSAVLGVGFWIYGTRTFAVQRGRGYGAATQGGQAGQARPGQGRKGPPLPIRPENPSIRHLRRNCRKCGRCREFCQNVTTVFGRTVPPGEDNCIHCGQCTLFCKANALDEKLHSPQVLRAIADREKIVIASTSPAIRVALGEMFGMLPGSDVQGKIVSSLRHLGVDHVLDTTFAADLTVMEEAAELLQRLQKPDDRHPLPMFTSCCPAWVRFAKLFYPRLLPNISTTKSPVLMQGAMIKTYFAEKQGLDPERIFHVALTPCTAKKAEILLPGMNGSGNAHGNPAPRDVDAVLTNRELGYLLKNARIDLAARPDAAYDSLMGSGSGAGMIFGNTGGVTEAALRTAFWMLNGQAPPKEFYRLETARDFENVREATVDLGKVKLKIAIAHGIGTSRTLLERIQSGKTDYHFVEVMACPGGCVGGGGQPRDHEADAETLRQRRREALYRRDPRDGLRLSYENPDITAVYGDFLGKPLGEKSMRLLHRT